MKTRYFYIFFLSLISLILGACSQTVLPTTVIPTNSFAASVPLDTLTPDPSPTPRRGEVTATTSPLATLGVSSAILPGFTPVPETPSPTTGTAECRDREGNIETGQLVTGLLSEPLDFRVYTPACYQRNIDRRYPVIYLIHGQSYTDDQWDRLGADNTADALIAAGEIPPFLIVMPRDRVWTQPDTDKFGEAVVQVLVPWIDSHYRTLTERKYRAIGGLSRGAGWAVHLALRHWELFGTLGAHSLPIFWSDTQTIKKWLDQIPYNQMPRIYLDIGDKDRTEIMESAVWFENLLTKRGIPHEWHLFAGYHEEKYWQTHMEQYLRWYTENW